MLDEGKEQPILHFSAGEEPLDLILLFDVSGSMRPKVQEVAAAAREGVQELRPGDRVAMMVFNTRTRMLLRFTDDLEAVQRSIQEDVMGLRFGGGTFIQSAVSDAARRFMRQPRTERRRAVLIITDDYGQRTRKESTVVRELWEADALLTGLIVRSKAVQTVRTIGTIMHPYLIGLQAGVKGIAEKTGGDFIHAGDAGAAFRSRCGASATAIASITRCRTRSRKPRGRCTSSYRRRRRSDFRRRGCGHGPDTSHRRSRKCERPRDQFASAALQNGAEVFEGGSGVGKRGEQIGGDVGVRRLRSDSEKGREQHFHSARSLEYLLDRGLPGRVAVCWPSLGGS